MLGSTRPTLDYIRTSLGVPAYVGAKVRYRGRDGTIRGAMKSPPWLKIEVEGENALVIAHPLRDVQYVAGTGEAAA